jgi:hypothetical protein
MDGEIIDNDALRSATVRAIESIAMSCPRKICNELLYLLSLLEEIYDCPEKPRFKSEYETILNN